MENERVNWGKVVGRKKDNKEENGIWHHLGGKTKWMTSLGSAWRS